MQCIRLLWTALKSLQQKSLSPCMEAATFLLFYSLSRGRACKFRPLFFRVQYTRLASSHSTLALDSMLHRIFSGLHASLLRCRRALGDMTSAIYNATLYLADTDIDVVVKFTTRYNEDANRLPAEANLAPRLHHCLRIVWDVYMVIMDYVKDAKTVWQLLEDQAQINPIVL
ncbi:hypothetical protein HYPSUDRAFT_1065925 [Hypholoma sublateritium FD-334 SS-4]|uniref:Uncharacterized protein n=1 Tax=Hypholoma sublateritium (strain FD-334 SS-4) TaxID=945553 RepID=A0A0D2P661_HYPSF|nr:hypothetical protein HYPSUDRAFT_1065925 [Hypholoma sublateritium FD-334 SS-4]